MGYLLPGDQVGEGEGRAPELPVEPEAEVVQGDGGGQPRLEAGEVMGPVRPQPERVLQLSEDGLDDLAAPAQPALERRGPGLAAVVLRRADDQGVVVGPPVPVV